MLHVICTPLQPGHLSVRVGDSSQPSEEIIKISNCAFEYDYYYNTSYHQDSCYWYTLMFFEIGVCYYCTAWVVATLVTTEIAVTGIH